MKNTYKILVAILFCLSDVSSFAQAPQAIPYQAVARDNSGNAITNQWIAVRFSIRNATAGGTILYQETHMLTTNGLGLFTANVGTGTIVSGSFGAIDWTTNLKFLQVEFDPTGGSSYLNMGTQQMLSVPFSFYSSQSGNSWSLTGNTGLVDGVHFIGTTSGVPLNFIVGNEKSGRIEPSALGNTFFGYRSGKSILTGSLNTGMGTDALKLNNSGVSNTALGCLALSANTSGYENIAVGANALNTNVSGFWNTAVGVEALKVNTNSSNTALGYSTLATNSSGTNNTAVGVYGLYSNTTGADNVSLGVDALKNNSNGNSNTAIGKNVLKSNISGNNNTALGVLALSNGTGSSNISIGASSGVNLTAGNSNIYIGNPGIGGDNFQIRIGVQGIQSGFYAGGIYGVAVSSGIPTYINSSGQIGTIVSSKKFKKDIADMGNVSDKIYNLRPVTYFYKDEIAQGDHSLQYGLIAEETEEIYPDLVARDNKGDILTVRYHLLTPLMLNELIKEHKLRMEQDEKISVLMSDMEKLKKENSELKENYENILAEIEKIKVKMAMSVSAER